MIRSLTLLSAASIFALATPADAANFLPFTTGGQAMMTAGSGFTYKPVYTVGDTLANGYQSVGIFDGIGAYSLNSTTVRLLVNHELGSTAGKAYTVVDGLGGTVSLTGARVSYFDIDRATMGVVNAGQAYDRIYDRAGNLVSSAAQLNGGLSRFCSSAAFEANSFGAGRGLSDRAYFTGEETANGTMYVLDTASNQLHAAPALGRGAWENASQIDTGTTNKVAFILSDDTSGSASSYGSPLYMYVGTKNAKGDGSFLDRNGLADGKMYAWAANSGDANPTTFNGNSPTRDGKWVEIGNFDATKAGAPGYDALGYADQTTLRANAATAGAFRFSRPEDVATSPGNGTLVALASTGSGLLNGADRWGTVYTIATGFDASGAPVTATIKVIYDGNADSGHKLRSPDNLTWAGDGALLVQEDNATNWVPGGNLTEAQVVKLTLDGTVTTASVMDRTALQGGVDVEAGNLGAWESSGILDVSTLWGLKDGSLFVGGVQAHGLKNTTLVEGGQLFFLAASAGAVPEPASWLSMIAGFGVIGMASRRRKRLRVFAAS
jgi:secreted PhoX family phosphatase